MRWPGELTCDSKSYIDAVLNHKMGADRTERFKAVEVDTNDRTKEISDPYDIEVSTDAL